MDTRIFNLCTMALAISSTYASLTIKPEYLKLVILKGSTLKLECLHQFQGKGADITFRKDGAILTSNLELKERSVPNEFNLQTYIYEKSVTLADTGNYECKLDDTGVTSAIHVYVFRTPDCANQTYVEGKDLKLECDLARSDKGILEYTVSWEHNNVALKTNEDAKYSIVSNTLRIQNPKPADFGAYYPVFTFFPNSNADRQTIKVAPVAVLAEAKVESLDCNKNIEFKCKAFGYPKPDIIWWKDEAKVNTKDKRVQLESYEGTENAKLIIYSPKSEDEGDYKCSAVNRINSKPNEKTVEYDAGTGAPNWAIVLMAVLIVILSLVVVGLVAVLCKRSK